MLDFVMRRIVGTKNDRDLKKIRSRVEAINRLEDHVKVVTPHELALLVRECLAPEGRN